MFELSVGVTSTAAGRITSPTKSKTTNVTDGEIFDANDRSIASYGVKNKKRYG